MNALLTLFSLNLIVVIVVIVRAIFKPEQYGY